MGTILRKKRQVSLDNYKNDHQFNISKNKRTSSLNET